MPAQTEISAAGSLVRSAVPVTLAAERPRTSSITTYTVQAGDTLWGIAAKLNLDAETLIWANGMEDNPDLLRLGQDLTVLPVNGVLHTVVKGDTVESVAKKYKAKPEDILGFENNHLDPKNPALAVGTKIIVPSGTKPMPARPGSPTRAPTKRAPVVRGHFVWPTSGSITQSFWAYHRCNRHCCLDRQPGQSGRRRERYLRGLEQHRLRQHDPDRPWQRLYHALRAPEQDPGTVRERRQHRANRSG